MKEGRPGNRAGLRTRGFEVRETGRKTRRGKTVVCLSWEDVEVGESFIYIAFDGREWDMVLVTKRSARGGSWIVDIPQPKGKMQRTVMYSMRRLIRMGRIWQEGGRQ
jgi:hypothetical protein